MQACRSVFAHGFFSRIYICTRSRVQTTRAQSIARLALGAGHVHAGQAVASHPHPAAHEGFCSHAIFAVSPGGECQGSGVGLQSPGGCAAAVRAHESTGRRERLPPPPLPY